MSLFYFAYRYNVFFVTDSQIDTKGLIYPRALQHLLTGVYLSEICLIGLFGIAGAIGPVILMVVTLIFTLDPLLYSLPRTLEVEEESLRGEILEAGQGDGTGLKEKNGGTTVGPAPTKKPNMFTKFFKPHVFADYHTLRKLVPHGLVDADNLYEEAVERNAYYPPSVVSEIPLLWIPRDAGGVSAQEIAHTSRIIPITDEGCTIDDKNKLQWDQEGARPPLWSEKIYY
jgi:hypothetical protein